MLTKEFCEYLEWKVSEALLTLKEAGQKGYWCDGILLPPSEESYSQKTVNDTRKVITTAWIAKGSSQQERYELVIIFGKYALRRYAKGTALTDCVPSSEMTDWISFNPEKKWLEVQLK